MRRLHLGHLHQGRAGAGVAGADGAGGNGAYAAGDKDEAGRIAVGHRADLAVLAADPLTLPPPNWPTHRCC
ncbi:amidohydrolase family protein [Streptomyces sp. NPDC051644]|uniref:amidohydrolase family protein n=1 Tax=Streptomyces sp. NPDC051644 TaxID=3365666 RepID=UPI0037B625A0